jgi:hypothetical protein
MAKILFYGTRAKNVNIYQPAPAQDVGRIFYTSTELKSGNADIVNILPQSW